MCQQKACKAHKPLCRQIVADRQSVAEIIGLYLGSFAEEEACTWMKSKVLQWEGNAEGILALVLGQLFMFAAEHTDEDLEAFLVMHKRIFSLALCLHLVHVPNITITCSHVWVVIAMLCNGTVQGCLEHAQRLTGLRADFIKELPCWVAHDCNIAKHSTVCASTTQPSVIATAAPSKAWTDH